MLRLSSFVFRPWSFVLVPFLLAACSAPPSAPPPTADISRLPSVTPAGPPAPPPATTSVELADLAPTRATTVPTATPGVVETAAGPITPSMARLGLAAETYATLGDPNAPITVVEFADFGCEFCRRFHLFTFSQLRESYIDTGLVYYVYKDLPVVSNQGAIVAQAAECAGEQGYYWEMHDALFGEPERWMPNAEQARTAVTEIAAAIGADPAALAACLADERYAAEIDADFQEAQALRIFGTPAYFINGKLLSGAQPFSTWEAILTDELAQAQP